MSRRRKMGGKIRDYGVTHLETSYISKASLDFRASIKEFEGYVDEMQTTTTQLLDSWDGKGRNRFETEYIKMKSQLNDIVDELYDMYDALVDADVAYIDVDEEVAKKISVGTELDYVKE